VSDPGEWFLYDLKDTVQGQISPIVGMGLAAYAVRNHVYAFSATAKAWSALTLDDGVLATPIVNADGVTVESQGRLHFFHKRTGKWSDHESGVLINRKGHMFVFDTKTNTWTDLDADLGEIPKSK
jgi:hypothetical protein